jgi:site-specific recombinase XerD
METNLARITDTKPTLGPVSKQAAQYIENSLSDNTKRAYSTVWKQFNAWCRDRRVMVLPATNETIIEYISDLAAQGKKPSSIQLALAAVSFYHEVAGFDNPRANIYVRKTMSGINRTKGTAPNKRDPLRVKHLRHIRQNYPDTVEGVRDWAILALGFSGGFRRSELTALDVEDLIFDENGVRVIVRRSKTDQEGSGLKKFIGNGTHKETCPVLAVKRWLDVSGITLGPLFRSLNRAGKVSQGRTFTKGRFQGLYSDGRLPDHRIYDIVKAAASQIGLDPSRFGGHSLRSGFVTDGRAKGMSNANIMRVTGHKLDSTVNGYDRPTEAEVNATQIIGL